MANSQRNVVMHNMSGLIGDLLVFSRRHGLTVVGKAPPKRPNAKPTDVTRKFVKAATFARLAMADPTLKQAYEKLAGPGQSAFNMALTDYFNAPKVEDIDATAYIGAIGNIIKAVIPDNFMVKSVKITITKPDGTLLEQGNAIQDADGDHFSYTTTQANPVLAGTKISLDASDFPGNLTHLDKVLA